MEITKYRVELNKKRHCILVEENVSEWDGCDVSSPDLVVDMLNSCFRLDRAAEEHVYLLSLSTKNRVLGVFEVSHGSVEVSVMEPREIFMRVLLSGGKHFILAHNHPSGDVTPSTQDVETTKRIVDAAKIMRMALLDHIIIGDGYCSLREEGIVK